MWQMRLRDVYENDERQWRYFSTVYNLARRLGFRSMRSAWSANPMVRGSTNPRDYSAVKENDHV
jgi:hypothetical protein